MQCKLSVVIPCYNEEQRLPIAIQALSHYFGSSAELTEIIIVNDGSQDRTAELVLHWAQREPRVKLLQHFPNRGKGYAIKQGMLAATGDWVVFMDADMATPIAMWDRFRPLLAQSSVIIGTRKNKQALVLRRQPWYRENMGKVFTLLSSVLLGVWISDFTCGFKAFRKDVCQAIFGRQQIFDWSYDAEIMFLAQRLGHRVVEVPVTWTNDDKTRVRLLDATLKAIWGLLKIRWVHR